LARCGMNVVLMSRSTQKLEKVAEIIGKLNLLIIATGGSTVHVYVIVQLSEKLCNVLGHLMIIDRIVHVISLITINKRLL